MSVTNKWLTPYQRSYQQIKTKLLTELKKVKDANNNQLITDYSEGNIFIMIISLFSAIAEVLHYYIDSMARETFFSTARRYDSLIKHGELVDYHAHGAVAATADVLVTRPLLSDNIDAEVQISKDWIFTDTSGNKWMVVKDTTWDKNTTSVSVPCIQHEFYEDTSMEGTVIATVNDVTQRVYQLASVGNGKQYEHGTMSLTIGSDTWTLVDTFAFSKADDTHFMVSVDSSKNVSIIFGDGVHGKIPTAGAKITSCTYYITRGSTGNVASGSITSMPMGLLSSVSDATSSNIYDAGGGSDYEDFDMLKEHIPLHVRTLGVAITKQDFIDIAMQVPGVNKVAAEYECGRKLNLYIVPDGGGVASSTLCDTVYQVLTQKAPLTTWLTINPAGYTYIKLDVTVTGRKSFTADTINSQIVQALLDKYSVNNSEIGGQVRISDLYALMDNLSSVDYLNINKFYLKPWPTTLYGNTSLSIDQFTVNSAEGSMTYFIIFTDSQNYQIRSKSGGILTEGTVGTSVYINDTVNNISFSISISDNNYKAGYKYSFVISEPNKDYVEPGYNLPVFLDSDQIHLTINEVV